VGVGARRAAGFGTPVYVASGSSLGGQIRTRAAAVDGNSIRIVTALLLRVAAARQALQILRSHRLIVRTRVRAIARVRMAFADCGRRIFAARSDARLQGFPRRRAWLGRGVVGAGLVCCGSELAAAAAAKAEVGASRGMTGAQVLAAFEQTGTVLMRASGGRGASEGKRGHGEE
jgi:hypothetical protein